MTLLVAKERDNGGFVLFPAHLARMSFFKIVRDCIFSSHPPDDLEVL